MPKVEFEPIVAVALIRDNAGRYLHVQEAQVDSYGLWGPPGGHVERERNERPREAAIREVKEETGLDIELAEFAPRYIGWYKKERAPYVVYLGQIVGGQLKIQEDELLGAQWFSVNQQESLEQEGLLRCSDSLAAVLKVDRAYTRN